MLVSQAHSLTQQARLAITLAWVAGYTNIVSVISCGTVTSHVTGNVSQFAKDVLEGRWALAWFLGFVLAWFFVGATLSGVATEIARRRTWQSIYVLPMALQALFLALFAILLEVGGHHENKSDSMLFALSGLASLSMGLQNATITRISSGVVRTTHLTGVWTDLGLESAQLGFWAWDRVKHRRALNAPIRELISHPSARRWLLLASIVASYALGAGLGTVIYDNFAKWAMFPPVAFLLWIIVQDIRVPICEVEPSDIVAEQGLTLPRSMLVFNLRAPQASRAALHTLPDMGRWFERLPMDVKVVVIDLQAGTVVDSDGAMELRELARRFKASGRSLIISGISPRQYAALRSIEAPGLLDPSNLCPDFELALARGIWLADQS